jgi:hypothetical protein
MSSWLARFSPLYQLPPHPSSFIYLIHPNYPQAGPTHFLTPHFTLPTGPLLRSHPFLSSLSLSQNHTSHYRKDGLCRAPNDLPDAFYRAHGKGHSLPCAYDTPHGSDKRTVQISLPCVVPQAHGKERPLPCVGSARTAKRPRHVRRP